MKQHIGLGILTFGLLSMSIPAISLSQERTSTGSAPDQTNIQSTMPAFPPSEKCSTSSPCRNVEGEIVKIEESYWIKQPNGIESHVRVKPNTKIDSRVKVGDSIAAQLLSNGDAEAVVRLKESTKAETLPVPSKDLQDMR
jgi:hypothetical protein